MGWWITAATLVDAVPTEIRENFERARKLHIYGVLEYEFFTAAPEYALLVLEAVLRVRFRTIEAPPGSSRMLRTVAEHINRLWGERTPGGRHFPGPIARRPRVVGLAPDGTASRQFAPTQIREVPSGERDWNFFVFLAAEEEELTLPHRGLRLTHREGFQTTIYPCEPLWEGGWQELVDAVEAAGFDDAGDVVEHLDRLFWIRPAEGEIDPARGAEGLFACPDPPEGHWCSLIADTPHEALDHVRQHEDVLDQRAVRSPTNCEDCLIEVLGRGNGYPHEVKDLPATTSRAPPGGRRSRGASSPGRAVPRHLRGGRRTLPRAR